MRKSPASIEYLEKYSVAPSPSRDYYGIKVISDQVILYTWRISHGPHTSPIVRISRFSDFSQDKTMHDEIQRVFGEPIFRHVETIAKGKKNTLLTLPKYLIKKLTAYLTFRDVSQLSTLSHVAKEVFNGDMIWEVLYKRHKMGLVYRDEKDQGSSLGWKRLFKERQMHKPARNRKVKKLTSDHPLVASRSSIPLTKRPSSSNGSLSLKNQKGTTSSTKLLIGTGIQTPKSMGLKSNFNSSGRPSTVSKKKPGTEIKGCKLLSTRGVKNDEEVFVEKSESKTTSTDQIDVKRQEEPGKDLSMIFKSTSIGNTGKKCISEDNFGNKTDRKTTLKNPEGRTSSDQNSAIGDGKSSVKKSQISLKNFAELAEKSNPSSVRKIGNEAAGSKTKSLSTRCDRKSLESGANKKENPKLGERSKIHKTEKSLLETKNGVSSNGDFGLEELIRASITEEHLSSENFLPNDFWRNRNCSEAISNGVKNTGRKLSKTNSFSVGSKAAIHQKFSSPQRPRAEINSAGSKSSITKSPEISAKKFADIKLYLKRNDGKKVSSRILKSDDRRCDKVEFCGSVKMASDKNATKYKTRIQSKTESSESLGSRFKSIESSKRLGLKKRGSLKK